MENDGAKLIIDGNSAKLEILLSIHEAQKSIRIRMFMWRDDRAGNMILQALCRKSQLFPHINISIEKDIFGSMVYNAQYIMSLGKMKRDIFSVPLYKLLVENRDNIRFKYIGGWWPFRRNYLQNNDHSKVFLFDENTDSKSAIIGGMNIADQYLTPQMQDVSQGGWHDYMVKVVGSSVDTIGKSRGKKVKKGIRRSLLTGIEIFRTLHDRLVMRKRIIYELSLAKTSIIIEHAYFTDMKIIRKLRTLSRKGISISVIFSRYSDGAWNANMHSATKLLKTSIIHQHDRNTLKVFIYSGMIHAKVILIDESVAIIGSANLTRGSFALLHETNVIIRDNHEIISSLKNQLVKDIIESRCLTIETIPRYSRLLAWLEKWFI